MSEATYLTRTCPKCFDLMTLISSEPEALNQPVRRYVCRNRDCGYWEPTYSLRDEA